MLAVMQFLLCDSFSGPVLNTAPLDILLSPQVVLSSAGFMQITQFLLKSRSVAAA